VQQIHTILSTILQSILIGFGILIPIFSVLKTSNLKTVEAKDLFVLTAIQVVRIAGLFYFIIWALDTYTIYSESIGLKDGMNIFKFRLFGQFWMLYWLPPVFSLLLTQALWIKKMYMKKVALITFALLILILPSYPFILLLSYLKGTDISGFNKNTVLQQVLYYVLSVVIFFFVTVTIMLMGGKLKNKR